MTTSFPLLNRDKSAPIAFVTKPIDYFHQPAGIIDTTRFLAHVNCVAKTLDNCDNVINLCENRYLFLVGFAAAIVSKKTNLLPPNSSQVTQRQLTESYPNSLVLHEGLDTLSSVPNVNIAEVSFDLNAPVTCDVPYIEDNHLACISFTSGSTGPSQPNLKYWRTLHTSTKINLHNMLPDLGDTVYQLATVPAQHMWGLETSILMPLFGDVCMSDAKPLFPQDIVDTLKMLPRPRMLVSTPVHLRALSSVACTDLNLHSILCATSPLTAELARDTERQCGASLREVYGCSEVGSMAVRRTAVEKTWLCFEGIELTPDGDDIRASANHLPTDVVLQDRIQLHGEYHFTLCGRASDLIKIAGKRGSLFDLNRILLGFDGLRDGVIVRPESSLEVTRLCAIVAFNEGSDKTSLIRYLRERIDSAFVPRPIYVVDSLPREKNGKLLKNKIDALLNEVKAGGK